MHVDWIFEFPARYALTPLEAVPPGPNLPVVHLPGRAVRAHPGPTVKIAPATGDAWIAVFHGGAPHHGWAPTQLIGWPDEISVGYVAGGTAYAVRTDDPSAVLEIAEEAIRDVIVSPVHRLVVFADWVKLTAYGPEGFAWEADVASDQLAIERIEGDVLECRAFIYGQTNVRFQVHLPTGGSNSPYDG